MVSAGAWLLNEALKNLMQSKIAIELEGFSEQQEKLFTLIQNKAASINEPPTAKRPLNWLAKIGKSTLTQWDEFYKFLSFIGKLSIDTLKIIFSPLRLRIKEIIGIMDSAGYQALPIIALLSFMIGVVISYQMGNQLKNYGANVFIIDLIGFSILREFGPLLTAIMVAGRTGSAFTAHLGLMKVNEEIDALNTLGIPPNELLLLPRIIALVIVMPLLTIWADIFGVLGGMIMAKNVLAISWSDFLTRFEAQIPPKALIIGLGKAPLFALIIAGIACFEGMQVQGSAESVGKRTTRSVVLSIFFIIVADSIVSILLSLNNL
jgi:phospholipid/cholesterol/gamma-HCH transport system permease protein